MREFLKALRQACGLGALACAMFVVGAWGKSLIDHPEPLQLEDDETKQTIAPISRSGVIDLFGSTVSDSSSPFEPQMNWHLNGLYQHGQIWVAPERPCMLLAVVGAQQTGMMESIRLGVPSITAPSTDGTREDVLWQGEKMEIARSSENPPSLATTETNDRNQPADALQSEIAGVAAPLIILDDQAMPIDSSPSAQITSDWGLLGLRLLHLEDSDGDTSIYAAVPHWMIAIPLLTLATMLLVPVRSLWNARRQRQANATPQPKPARLGWQLSAGITRYAGIATLAVAVMLAVGWTRSLFTSDIFAVTLAQNWGVVVASARDGLMLRTHPTGGFPTPPFDYRSITGAGAGDVSFRPRGMDVELNFQEFASTVPPSGGEPGGVEEAAGPLTGISPPATIVGLAQPGTVVGMAAPAMLAGSSQIELSGATTLSPIDAEPPQLIDEEGEDPAISQTAPNRPKSIVVPSDALAWTGFSFDWLGTYFSYSDGDIALVLPYWLLTIPATVLSATFLLRRRRADLAVRDQ